MKLRACLAVIFMGLVVTSVQAKQLPFTVINYDQRLGVGLEQDQKYFTIKEVVVNEITSEESLYVSDSNKNLGAVIASLDKLIAFGKKIWKIVEAGRPVSNSNMINYVSVLPKVDDPQGAFYEMENWQGPQIKRYKVEYKNLYGASVVSFVYSVRFDYGGQYEGKGKYLTGVGVEAENITVGWGFEFNASNAVISITNRGTKDDPIASVSMKLSYEAKSILRTIKSSESFYLTGNGALKKL